MVGSCVFIHWQNAADSADLTWLCIRIEWNRGLQAFYSSKNWIISCGNLVVGPLWSNQSFFRPAFFVKQEFFFCGPKFERVLQGFAKTWRLPLWVNLQPLKLSSSAPFQGPSLRIILICSVEAIIFFEEPGQNAVHFGSFFYNWIEITLW